MFWSLLKDPTAILAFIKEMLLGDSDLSRVVRRNKLTTTFVVLNVLMFILLVFMTRQANYLTTEVVAKKHEIQTLKDQLKTLVPPDAGQIQTAATIANRIKGLQEEVTFYKQQVELCHVEHKQPAVNQTAPIRVHRGPIPKPDNALREKLQALRNEDYP